MPEKDIRRVAGKDYPKVNTFTAASARRLSELTLTPPEMYPAEAAEYLDSDLVTGLDRRQVRQRRAKYGDNTETGMPIGFVKSLERQLKNLPNVLLMGSLIMFYAFRGGAWFPLTALLMAISFPVNAFLEYRASLTFAKMNRVASPRATVLREGRQFVTDSRSLVPGDVIVLETDSIVPADARLIETQSFRVMESPVGGVPRSVEKDARFVAESKEDRLYENMVYSGSVVTSGKATAIVCATGKDTRLAKKRESNPASAMPKYLRNASFALRLVSVTSVLGALVLLLLGVLRGENVSDTFITALAVACCAMCETAFVLLLYGESSALAAALQAGCVFRSPDSVPAIARTDTVMCCKDMAFPPSEITLKEIFVCFDSLEFNSRSGSNVTDIIRCMILCSSLKERLRAQPQKRKKRRESAPARVYEGSEFTLAVVNAASRAGYSVEDAKKDFYRIEAEFDSSGEACRVLGMLEGKNCVILRGSPESVLARCAGYRREGRNYRLDKRSAERILYSASQMAKTQIPVAVAMGYTQAESLHDINVENKLIFLGFAGFYTETGIDTASSVYRLGNAGISLAVNTDDAYYAAYNLAENAGVISRESEICTPEILHESDEGLFAEDNENYRVFNRLTDEEWLYILRLRNAARHKVFAQVSSAGQSDIVSEANASFAVAGKSKDALLQKCDVRFTSPGFPAIETAISRSKLAVKRIAAVCQYMSAGYYILFFWCLLSLAFGKGLPFGVPGATVYGMVLNPLLAFSLAFCPVTAKTLYDRSGSVSPDRLSGSMTHAVIYSAVCGVMCFIAANVLGPGGGAGSCAAFAAYSFSLWLYTTVCGFRGSALSNLFYRNYLLLPSLFVTAAFALIPALVPAVGAFIDFETPELRALGASIALPFVLWLGLQAVLLIKEITDKNKGRHAKKRK